MRGIDFDAVAEAVSPDQLARALGAEKRGRGWRCPSPDHDDTDPSCSFFRDGSRTAVKCHGCGFGGSPVSVASLVWGMEPGEAAKRLVAELGLSVVTNGSRPEIVAEYDYTDEDGSLLFQVVRFGPKKDFRQRRPDGRGGWEWRLGDTRRVLYRLPEVTEAVALGKTVYLCEGEKDVHAMESAAAVATCNPGGAGKWRPEYSETLRGAEVAIVADRDEPGREHASKVADALDGIAASVCIVEPAEGKDAADHIGAGHGLDDFAPLGPEGQPSPWTALDSEDVEAMVAAKRRPPDAVPTPFESWNRVCRDEGAGVGIARGWHITIGARSGAGKSLLGANLTRAAVEAGEQVGQVSLEMSQAQLDTRQLAVLAGVPVRDLEPGDGFREDTLRRALQRVQEIREEYGGRIFRSPELIRGVGGVEDAIRHLHETHGCAYFIVDYLQLAGNPNDPASITDVSHRVRQLARDLNVITVCLSQFNRDTFRRGGSPTIHDLTGGSAIENDSDQVALLDHTKMEKVPEGWDAELAVAKNRHGPSTSIPVRFHTKTLRFEELLPDEQPSLKVG